MDAKKGGFAEIIIILVVLVLAGLAGAYYLGHGTNKPQPSPNTTAILQTSPAPTKPTFSPTTQDETANWKTYTNTKYNYFFKYPPNWEVFDKVPGKFSAKPDIVESGGNLEVFLSRKMFIEESCRGPVLQNTSDNNQLIVFEVVDTNSDGGFCWSVGYFMDEDKWKVSKEYVYPIGSNNRYTPEWKGDYLKMERAGGNKQFTAMVSLVNYETFQLKGDDVLQSIISTFKFTD